MVAVAATLALVLAAPRPTASLEVLSWGAYAQGGALAPGSKLCTNVTKVHAVASFDAFSALRADGTVACWGASTLDCSEASHYLTGVREIVSSRSAMSGLTRDDRVVAWGDVSQSQGVFPSAVVDVACINTDCAVVLEGGAVYHIPTGQPVVSKDLVKLVTTNSDFAALAGGRVVSWGSSGLYSVPSMCETLAQVADIYSTSQAFAALTRRGEVVCWGSSAHGGDCSSLRGLLRGVTKVGSTAAAFAAVTAGGRVVPWVSPYSLNHDQLPYELTSQVVDVHSLGLAFAAELKSGALVPVGHIEGFIVSRHIHRIVAANGVFGAIDELGGLQLVLSISGVSLAQRLLVVANVSKVASSGSTIAAVKLDGSVAVLGARQPPVDTVPLLSNVSQVVAVSDTFAALRVDGRVVLWGVHAGAGAPDSPVASLLESGVLSVHSSGTSLAAVLDGGEGVVAWGPAGAVHTSLAPLPSSVVGSGQNAFAGITEAGHIVCWGTTSSAATDCSSAAGLLPNALHIVAANRAFAAWNASGHVVA